MEVDPALVHRLFYPQVPAVFAARSGKQVSAMPVVSVVALSMRPALIGVACFPSGFTLGLAVKSGTFSISFLHRRHLKKMSKLAETSGLRTKDKVRLSGLHLERQPAAGAPVFKEAEAWLGCRVLSSNDIGDHVFVTGEVTSSGAKGAFKDNWDYAKYEPILYSGWKKGGMTVYRPKA